MALYRRALERAHAVWIYRYLASSILGAGRMAEAKETFAEMTRKLLGLTVTKFRQAMPSGPIIDRMIDNLRNLGLPDRSGR